MLLILLFWETDVAPVPLFDGFVYSGKAWEKMELDPKNKSRLFAFCVKTLIPNQQFERYQHKKVQINK